MKNKNLRIKLIAKHIQSIPKLYKSFNFSNVHQKYSLNEYLIDIFYVLKTGIVWRDLRSKINWNSVYSVYNKLNKHKIFEIAYTVLLNKYIKKGTNGKLKIVMTDTTFIPNKKGHDVIGYNKYYNRKNGTKLSLITDLNGSVISVKHFKGNKYDSVILQDHIRSKFLIENNQRNIILADTGYDSRKLRETLISLDYKPIIDYNKRNTKDTTKIKRLTKDEIKIYNKRSTIERTINRIKMNKRINLRYDSKIQNFMGFVYLALISILCK